MGREVTFLGQGFSVELRFSCASLICTVMVRLAISRCILQTLALDDARC